MRQDVLNRIHHGHQRITTCKARAYESVWWQGISPQIRPRMNTVHTENQQETRAVVSNTIHRKTMATSWHGLQKMATLQKMIFTCDWLLLKIPRSCAPHKSVNNIRNWSPDINLHQTRYARKTIQRQWSASSKAWHVRVPQIFPRLGLSPPDFPSEILTKQPFCRGYSQNTQTRLEEDWWRLSRISILRSHASWKRLQPVRAPDEKTYKDLSTYDRK